MGKTYSSNVSFRTSGLAFRPERARAAHGQLQRRRSLPAAFGIVAAEPESSFLGRFGSTGMSATIRPGRAAITAIRVER